MYLTRLRLDPKNRWVRRDLGDCKEMHRTVMSAFSNVDDSQTARASLAVLFRVEPPTREGQIVLIVQSSEKPAWNNLPTGYLDDSVPDSVSCKEIDATYDHLRAGMRLRFRLRANPTRKVDTKSGSHGEKRNGRREPLHGEDQITWLKRQAERNGFELVTHRTNQSVTAVNVNPTTKIVGRENDSRITLAAVQFDGELIISDARQFHLALEQGIGPGKAYGLGLLSIAPA